MSEIKMLRHTDVEESERRRWKDRRSERGWIDSNLCEPAEREREGEKAKMF